MVVVVAVVVGGSSGGGLWRWRCIMVVVVMVVAGSGWGDEGKAMVGAVMVVGRRCVWHDGGGVVLGIA